jgi:hypothetical protein
MGQRNSIISTQEIVTAVKAKKKKKDTITKNPMLSVLATVFREIHWGEKPSEPHTTAVGISS